MTIAGAALQSLTYSAKRQDPIDIAAITRLTGLTALHLEQVDWSTGLEALRSLPLQSLSLRNCPGAEFIFLVPGALTALRQLEVTEATRYIVNLTQWWRFITNSELEAHQALQNTFQLLREVGDTVLRLPNLVKLSGSSSLLMVGIRNGQNGWTRQTPWTYSQGCGSVQGCYCFQCCACLQLWTRAHEL